MVPRYKPSSTPREMSRSELREAYEHTCESPPDYGRRYSQEIDRRDRLRHDMILLTLTVVVTIATLINLALAAVVVFGR